MTVPPFYENLPPSTQRDISPEAMFECDWTRKWHHPMLSPGHLDPETTWSVA